MSRKKIKKKISSEITNLDKSVLELVFQGKDLEQIMEELGIDLITCNEALLRIFKQLPSSYTGDLV